MLNGYIIYLSNTAIQSVSEKKTFEVLSEAVNI